jgi:hypothetical protein
LLFQDADVATGVLAVLAAADAICARARRVGRGTVLPLRVVTIVGVARDGSYEIGVLNGDVMEGYY